MEPARVEVLGVRVSAINMDMAVETVGEWVENGDRTYVCVTGVHGVIESQKDADLLDIHNNSGLTTPDGMPMVWAGRYAGAHWMDRVYGPDMMLAVLAEAERRGWTSFFYGGAADIPGRLVERLQERFPGMKVAGVYSPPFRDLSAEEESEVAELINASGADLVWVGLSTPKQERWMARFRPRLGSAVIFGVGAAFDFHAGAVSQAPAWMQRSGLEWLFRLTREPRRLWRRYTSIIPRFVGRILVDRPVLIPSEAPAPQPRG